MLWVLLESIVRMCLEFVLFFGLLIFCLLNDISVLLVRIILFLVIVCLFLRCVFIVWVFLLVSFVISFIGGLLLWGDLLILVGCIVWVMFICLSKVVCCGEVDVNIIDFVIGLFLV